MTDEILSLRGLNKTFETASGVLTAVSDVSMTIRRGETYALAGESGCGKSTLGKIVAALVKPDSGSVTVDGVDLTALPPGKLRPIRRKVQMIFQDPFSSLNPRSTVRRIIEEPLIVHRLGDRAERRRLVDAMMERVGLRQDAADRYPHEFSGGQRQRIGIARALILKPELLVCDEPVSALDVSVRAQVLNLLRELQADMGLAYLFISHDLSVIQYLADRVAVMHLGKLVETAPRVPFWASPQHPYSRALIAARPNPDPRVRLQDKPILEGELPSPFGTQLGCDFRSRCPLAFDRCATSSPKLRLAAPDHFAACHLGEAA
jgi:peptide/nickel transport system ATP-binding protein